MRVNLWIIRETFFKTYLLFLYQFLPTRQQARAVLTFGHRNNDPQNLRWIQEKSDSISRFNCTVFFYVHSCWRNKTRSEVITLLLATVSERQAPPIHARKLLLQNGFCFFRSDSQTSSVFSMHFDDNCQQRIYWVIRIFAFTIVARIHNRCQNCIKVSRSLCSYWEGH